MPGQVGLVDPAQQSRLPTDAAAQLPWPQQSPPDRVVWEQFAFFDNFWEGQILGGLLTNEGIPNVVMYTSPSIDLTSYSVVYVANELAHRARWILSWPAPTEEELTFLATGEFPGDDATR